jgi:poly-gamma-glutamate capsule biosynthesis protein CapA/YwtB (metallophosphatase superfamily)
MRHIPSLSKLGRLFENCGGIAFLLLILVACQAGNDYAGMHSAPPITPAATSSPLETVNQSLAQVSPTATEETPQKIVLFVPTRWGEAAEQAIEDLTKAGTVYEWHVEVISDAQENLPVEAHLSLVPDASGSPAGERPIAMAVPFASEWGPLSLEEALELLQQNSPFVAGIDWDDMSPTFSALPVAGLLPGDPLYPLQQPWSISAPESLKAAASDLATAIRPYIEFDEVVHLAAVGDIMLDRALGDTLRSGDIDYPFVPIGDTLLTPDYTIGNLESALGETGQPENKGYTFQAPPEAAKALGHAGFDILTLANNHAMDFGVEGLLEAINLIEANGMVAVGAGIDANEARSPVVLSRNNFNIAILAYVDVPVEFRGFDVRTWEAGPDSAGVAWADPVDIQEDVSTALKNSDVVVVLLHSGYEYVERPSPPQVNAAHAAIDAGASLVIGHHSHVLQPVEFYKDGVIVYGLANFTFEDAGPPETIILNVWIDEDGVRSIGIRPIIITPDGRPRLANDAEGLQILKSFYALSVEP